MQWTRIKAVMYSYILQQRDSNRLLEVILWPLFDVFLGCIVSLWMLRDTSMTQEAYIPLFGIFFWQVVTRTYTDMGAFALTEVWNKNLSNLLSTPLQYGEWIISLMLVALLRALWVTVLCAFVIDYCFDISVLLFGWWLGVLVALLVLTGWAFGCIGVACAALWGSRVSSLIFSFWLLVPFCGTLYPIEVLPLSLQYMAMLMPLSYIFYAIQQFVLTGIMPLFHIMCAAGLSLLYIILGVMLYTSMIHRSKDLGFARLEAE